MKRFGEGIRGLVGASGGIGYHLAALRYASHLWQPFREDLARELVRRIPKPSETDLVLVGPSGGYCFEPAFLSSFRSILAVDIDPLAGAVLRKRAEKARFVRQDFFLKLEAAEWDLERWLFEIQAPPRATVLFSNLLGQLGFLFDERRMAKIEGGLVQALGTNVPWISFHDRFSVKVGISPRTFLEFPARPGSRELADAWTAKWVERGGSFGEIHEHEIGEWVSAGRGAFRYFPWRLDSHRTQLIEICGNGKN
jgi:hypothetical protein